MSGGRAPRGALPAILAAALVLRLAMIFWMPPDPVEALGPLSDAGDYDLLARQLLAGAGFSNAEGAATAFRPPFYPFFLAGIYALLGHSSLMAVAFVQALLGTVNVWLAALLARAIGGGPWAVLAAAAGTALYPAFVFQTPQILTEVVHRTLELGGLVQLSRAAKAATSTADLPLPSATCTGGTPVPRCSSLCFALGGVMLALAVLNKSVLAAAMPFITFWVLWVAWRGACAWRPAVLAALAFALPAMLLIGAWTGRNYIASGNFIPVSTNFSVTFAQGVTKHSYYTAQWNAPESLMPVPEGYLARTQLRYYGGIAEERAIGGAHAREARAFIAQRPGWFAALTVRKALHFWNPLIRNSRAAQLAALLTMTPVLLLGWCFVLRGLATGSGRATALLALAIALPVTLPHALSQPDVRYRLAIIDPLWLVMGAVFAESLWQRRAAAAPTPPTEAPARRTEKTAPP